MKKTVNQLWEEFQKELIENDKKVKEEKLTKSQEEKLKEFEDFIKTNKCKVLKGGKNGNK